MSVRNRKREIEREGGFTLIELLMASSLSLIAVLAATSVIAVITGAKVQTEHASAAYQMRLTMTQHLQSEQSWLNTVMDSANTSFSCLRNQTDCSGVSSGATFRLKDNFDRTVYDPSLASGSLLSGFGAQGLCTAFDPINGSNSCPFRYTLTWRPICPTVGPCVNPAVEVAAALVINSPKPEIMVLNGGNYSINLNHPGLNVAEERETHYVSIPSQNFTNNLTIALPKYNGDLPLRSAIIRVVLNPNFQVSAYRTGNFSMSSFFTYGMRIEGNGPLADLASEPSLSLQSLNMNSSMLGAPIFNPNFQMPFTHGLAYSSASTPAAPLVYNLRLNNPEDDSMIDNFSGEGDFSFSVIPNLTYVTGAGNPNTNMPALVLATATLSGTASVTYLSSRVPIYNVSFASP